MTAPLYLRDLKTSGQEEFIHQWKREKRTSLLKALARGQDIQIGEYCLDRHIKVIK